MASNGRELVETYYSLIAEPTDLDGLRQLYAADALVIRFNGTSTGLDEIAEFLTEVATRNEPYELRSIDQFTQVGDVVMWDGLIDTSKGVLETTEVMVLDDAGKIKRHIPGIRGYWGL